MTYARRLTLALLLLTSIGCECGAPPPPPQLPLGPPLRIDGAPQRVASVAEVIARTAPIAPPVVDAYGRSIESVEVKGAGALGGQLLFVVRNGGVFGLFRSDGSADGSGFLRAVTWGRDAWFHAPMARAGGRLLFTVDREEPRAHELVSVLWASDGTVEGTVEVTGVGPDVRVVASLGETVLLNTQDAAHGSELWRSDGTPQGTRLVADLTEGAGGSHVALLGTIGARALLDVRLNVGGDDQDRNTWVSDGTPQGTAQVAEIVANSTGDEFYLGEVDVDHDVPPLAAPLDGQTLLFAGWDDADGQELWRSDGTRRGTRLVKDINPGVEGRLENFFEGLIRKEGVDWDLSRNPYGSAPRAVASAEGKVFFTANDGTHGRELWVSDGTEEGTRLMRDLAPGPSDGEVKHPTGVGKRILFTADDGVHGRELWVSDGTEAGTVMLRDLAPGPASSAPSELFALSEAGPVVFSATDEKHGRELWVSDGTAEGTRLVGDLAGGGLGLNPHRFTLAEGRLFFFSADDGGNGLALWSVGVAQR